jgi:rubrerythrin
MKIKKKKENNLTCNRCGNIWMSTSKTPKKCPVCKSPNWNKVDMRKIIDLIIN